MVTLCAWLLVQRGLLPRKVTIMGAVAVMVAVASSTVKSLKWKRRAPSPTILLFVYGTLKKNFHWNQKFLSLRARFIANAQTLKPWPLVVGRCGVPYVLLKQPGPLGEQRVHGELWRIDEESLAALDDYEGITKGYYGRDQVECEVEANESCPDGVVKAQMFGVTDPSHFWDEDELRSLHCISEYSLERHKESYSAIEHISLKQQLYLAGVKRYNDLKDHIRPAQGEN